MAKKFKSFTIKKDILIDTRAKLLKHVPLSPEELKKLHEEKRFGENECKAILNFQAIDLEWWLTEKYPLLNRISRIAPGNPVQNILVALKLLLEFRQLSDENFLEEYKVNSFIRSINSSYYPTLHVHNLNQLS